MNFIFSYSALEHQPWYFFSSRQPLRKLELTKKIFLWYFLNGQMFACYYLINRLLVFELSACVFLAGGDSSIGQYG